MHQCKGYVFFATFFTSDCINKYWIPSLNDGKPVHGVGWCDADAVLAVLSTERNDLHGYYRTRSRAQIAREINNYDYKYLFAYSQEVYSTDKSASLTYFPVGKPYVNLAVQFPRPLKELDAHNLRNLLPNSSTTYLDRLYMPNYIITYYLIIIWIQFLEGTYVSHSH